MNISGISSTDPAYGQGGTQQTLDKDAFMRLLVSQLQNQDPTAPTDNQAFISQLAEFSSLEQMEDLNDNIVGLAVLQQGNALLSQLTSSSALIGKNISYVDPESGDTLQGQVTSVKIEDGLAVLNVGGEDVPLGNVQEILAGDVDGESSGDPTDDTGDDDSDNGDNA